ncbi:outer membrane beta-barrel protein [Rhizobium sp. NTR19]|uniref:Outer membrane beta-barrel protein n=1 Tax=Neorhizobium turbinariae TaxID=2937795 RepID=A0ABT0IMR0_9HYPH|nr:outer membrane beta-barrel protein [Neorhizobium turbinariae]MCK8779136.1 outer membrane beta-barrel protein [Neorhizobium turbinariae]
MTETTARGRTRKRRSKTFVLLLACSALASPALAQDRPLFPAQGSGLPSATSATPSAAPSGPDGAIEEAAQDGTAVPDYTASISADGPDEEPLYAEDLNRPADPPLDTFDELINTRDPLRTRTETPGIRLGTFLLRPSVNQSINTERTKSGGSTERRDYLSTNIRGTLTSDWSRHALTVTGSGTYERNINGGQDGLRPEAGIDADLRLDLAGDTQAHVTGGYSFTREEDYDPNAIGNADTQSGVHEFRAGASIQRDFGKVRGLAAVDVTRLNYTDAELSDGSSLSMRDRNRTGIDGRLRLGYELSPALIPFVEVATGRTLYELRRDNNGYARSSQSYAARTGVEFDFGEKLRGEIGAGYEIVDYEDSRLNSLDAFTVDGSVRWSPQRGTDVDLGLRTTVQDATAAGQSGWVEYQATAAVAHEMRDNLVARLTSTTTLRDLQNGRSDETVWVGGAGLAWAVNRYLDVTGNVEYERVTGGGANDSTLRAGIGMTVKR